MLHLSGEAFRFCTISLGVLSNTSKTSLITSHNANNQLRQALNLATLFKSFLWHKVKKDCVQFKSHNGTAIQARPKNEMMLKGNIPASAPQLQGCERPVITPSIQSEWPKLATTCKRMQSVINLQVFNDFDIPLHRDAENVGHRLCKSG